MGNPTNGKALQKQGHEHEHPGANCKCSQRREEHTEVRYLIRNLPSRELFRKIRRAERRMEAGERELGFYLLDLRCLFRKCRRAYKKVASSFHQFILNHTGLEPSKAGRLVQVALALESLPLMDQAFARGELY